jgi:hypothetical protein
MELRFRLIFALKSLSFDKQNLLSQEKLNNEKRLTHIVPKHLITKFKMHCQEIVERVASATVTVIKILNLDKMDYPALKLVEIVHIINSKVESIIEGTTVQFLHNTTSTLIVSVCYGNSNRFLVGYGTSMRAEACRVDARYCNVVVKLVQ